MTDKEVGELWRHADKPAVNLWWAGQVQQLICKLVEERGGYTQMNLPEGSKWAWNDCVNDACRDFGIDPKEFNDFRTS
jgi:hypothetical protein